MKKIKAVVLTSNAPRHKYFCQIAAENFDVCGIVSEPKHDYFEKQQESSDLVKKHFENLSFYEKKYFSGVDEFPQTEILLIDKLKINDSDTVVWVKKLKPDVVLLFGTGILDEQWMEAFDGRIINMHLGLSPYYRGSATLFWPFYNDELEAVGVTFHIASLKVDAGDIIQRFRPIVAIGDNYYDITNKTIRQSIEAMPQIVQSYLEGKIELVKQKFNSSCKCYRKADFNEDVLKDVLLKYSSGLDSGQVQELEQQKRCLINT